MKRGVKVPGRPGGCRSGCCRSLVWAGLVSAGRWSWCLVPLSGLLAGPGRLGPVLCSRLRGPVSSFGFEKRLQPREPSQRPVFRQVTLLQPGQLRFTWPWDLWFLRFLIIFLFSVCSGRCHFIQSFPRPLLSLRAKVVPAETGESELSIFFLHYASSTSRSVPSASLVVQTSLSRHTPAGSSRASAEAFVTTELSSTSGVHLRTPARNLHHKSVLAKSTLVSGYGKHWLLTLRGSGVPVLVIEVEAKCGR